MVVPLLSISARIAAMVAKSPTARAGIKKAIEKFGKSEVKKHIKNIPSLVRSQKIRKSAKEGEIARSKSKLMETQSKSGVTVRPRQSQESIIRARLRKKQVERGEIPDRRTTLGKRGYNFNDGGTVKRYKGGLMVKPKLAKGGY